MVRFLRNLLLFHLITLAASLGWDAVRPYHYLLLAPHRAPMEQEQKEQ